MPTKEKNNNNATSESLDDESIKALEKGEGKKDIDALQLDAGEEFVRFRKRWWQLWIPAGIPPPPPESLDDAEIIPIVSASILSQLTYTWITPIMKLGYQRTLQATDLWKVGPELEAGYLSEKLDAAWTKRVNAANEWNAGLDDGRINPPMFKRLIWAITALKGGLDYRNRRAALEKQWREVTGRKHASLAWAMNDVLGHMFWFGGVSKVIGDTAQLMGPILVKAIINFAKARATARLDGTEMPSIGRGVGMAVGLLWMVILASVFQHQFFWRSMTTGVMARAALTASIYKRGVRLTGKARTTLSNSDILNHVSTDVCARPLTAARSLTPTPTDQSDGCLRTVHAAWTAPIQGMFSHIWVLPYANWPTVSICLIILLTQLGPSALAGFSLFVVIIPVMERIMARQFKTRGKSMKFTDRRAKILLEVLSSMRVVKYFCYEVPFLKRIFAIRENEIRGILLHSHSPSPVLASTLAFVTYTRVTSGFDIAIIFSSFSLFQLLRQPMMFLPRALSNIADGRNALNRLTRVFYAEILTDVPFVINPSQEFALDVKDVSFEWESGSKDHDSKTKDSADKSKSTAETKALGKLKDEDADSQDDPPFRVQNINMRIPRGTLAGVVGRVGSGKSSLLQGLIGEMRRVGGEFSYGGKVAYCPQTAWIQNASLRDNALFGQPFDSDRYWSIMEKACLLPDLQLLPDGDLTEIGEKGINLSGGQKQRVNIARALYYDADIIIFDDPLSAVDANVGKSLFHNAVLGADPAREDGDIGHGARSLLFEGEFLSMGRIKNFSTRGGEFARLDKEFGGGNAEGESAENLVTVTVTVDQLKMKSARAAGTGKIEGKLITKERRTTGSVSWRIYGSYIKAGRGYITLPFIILAVLGMQGCQVTNSYTLVWWQQNLNPVQQIQPVVFVLSDSFYACLGVSQAMFTFLMGVGIDILSMAAAKNLHHDSVHNILYAPMSFFDTIPMGRIIGVFGKDIDTIDNLLSMSLRMFTLVMGNLSSSILLISILEHYFIIAAVAIACGYSYFASFYRASARELKRLDAMLRSVLYAHLSESLTGLPTIRSYGEIPRFIDTNKYYIDLENRALFLTVTNQRWLAIRLDVCGAIMVFFVAIFAIVGVSGISPAQIGLVLTYTTQLTQMCSMVTRQSAELENYMNSVERVVHYSRKDVIPQEAAYESDKDHKPPPEWPTRGAVEFKNVEMNYRPGLPNVLHGISMSINAGEKIGVVGRTGAGKSSLALTLLRIVEYSGTILVDDVDIGKIGLKDLRSNISIIPQDASPTLFSGTVRTVLDPFSRYDDARLWDALRRSFLVDSGTSTPISSLDNGEHPRHRIDLDTVVEIDGANLSVGERSLLSLARALVKDSKVVILDEATASVDLETDHKIQRTIQTQFKDNTLLCIAHRLRTIISYDRILVLEAGNIAEFDTPLTLFSRPDSIFRGLCDKSNITSADIEKAILFDRE
ncbi:ABC protein [Mycena venus]|uniref:ABC protein n=1 Tax=Mycena venus TaxID=2733690 RepID=A0A8H7CBM5_9AGAR|nr:ABC protein [Mycena venus]